MSSRLSKSDIEQLISDRKREDLHWEFKCLSQCNPANLDRETKKTLGEALSGFANAEGGRLIFGIATERTKDGDEAAALDHAAIHEALSVAFRSLIAEYLSPPGLGVECYSIEIVDGRGVVVVDIPKGEDRPYMSRAPGHQKYFRRSSDRFLPLENYEVYDLFNAKKAPSLEVRLSSNVNSFEGYGIGVYVRNRSAQLARFGFLEVRIPDQGPSVGRYGIDGNGNTPWRILPHGNWKRVSYSSGANEVIHSGQEVMVCVIEVRANPDRRENFKWSVASMADDEILNINFDLACEGMALQRWSFPFSKSDLAGRKIPVPLKSVSD